MILLQQFDSQGIITDVYKSSDSDDYNTVSIDLDEMKWFCSCEDFYFRNRKCKHIKMVQEFIDEKWAEYERKSEMMEVFYE